MAEHLGQVVYQGAKVFSATKAKEREGLGEHVTMWIRENPNIKIQHTTITQSSDSEFHCLAIIIFFDFQ